MKFEKCMYRVIAESEKAVKVVIYQNALDGEITTWCPKSQCNFGIKELKTTKGDTMQVNVVFEAAAWWIRETLAKRRYAAINGKLAKATFELGEFERSLGCVDGID